MIEYVDAWLCIWAQWSRAHNPRLGHASQSPVHRMMTENKATVSARKHRGRRRMLVVGGNLVVRSIEPMRAVETTRSHIERLPDHPLAEQMEEAYAHLRETIQREALRLKYLVGVGDYLAADLMGVSKTMYKAHINIAHASLDSYLRARYPSSVREIVGDVRIANNGRG